jgi:hypothetical protein
LKIERFILDTGFRSMAATRPDWAMGPETAMILKDWPDSIVSTDNMIEDFNRILTEDSEVD